MKKKIQTITIVKIIAIIMLFWALADNTYGYYQFLRWVIAGVSSYSAYLAYEQDNSVWTWILAITAILFNPIAPIHLDRETWSILNIIAAAIIFKSIFNMSQEQFYAKKPLEMVKNTECLITPFGPLYIADRDLLTFELSFFYYFIYDYKLFSQLDNELRRKIMNTFLEMVRLSRPDEFPDLKSIGKFYETRIFTYFTITREIGKQGKMGEFVDKCADYINTLLTYSEINNVFTCHNFDQAEKELKPNIEPNKYTDELKVLLTLTSSAIMIHGIDPIERDKDI